MLAGDCTVRVRFHLPPAALQPYFTTFYVLEMDVSGGGTVTDWLHPEWANLRLFQGGLPDSDLGGRDHVSGVPATFTGPSSRAVRFTIGSTRMWGIGLLPLGWARFAGLPASEMADRLLNPLPAPALAPFIPLIQCVFRDGEADEAAELARIVAYFTTRDVGEVPERARILAVHAALLEPDVGSVAEMAEVARLPAHTVERICRRHFGFPPRLLLRRQRFMRSLSQYMLDPSLKWIGAIDGHYHDQAQFVRDFHRFMGMSPRAYAALPHPVLAAVMQARQAAAGAAVQALHNPLKRR